MSNINFKLIFLRGGGMRFLEAAIFTSSEGNVNRKLTVTPMGGKILRSLCILILLAKYRGIAFEEDGVLWFRSKSDKLNWIKSLSGSLPKAEKIHKQFKGIFKEFFDGLKFVSVSRGNTNEKGALPFAAYLTEKLPLSNVEISVRSNGEVTPLVGNGLAEMAEEIELFEVVRSKLWTPCVPAFVKETKTDRETMSKRGHLKPFVRHSDENQAFIFSALWKELFHQVLDEMKARDLDGNWYAVCLNPKWLTDWKEVLFKGVKNHQVTIKVAFHSPFANLNSDAIKAQWNMNSSRIRGKSIKIEQEVKDIIRDALKEMRLWMKELGKPNANSFKFYRSNVVHPFAGLLYVPRDAKRLSKLKPVAPPGTWCLVMLYPFYQIDYETRCAIYFNATSPMLDIYYNSVLDFFDAGQSTGYIEPLDSLDSALEKPRRKARHG